MGCSPKELHQAGHRSALRGGLLSLFFSLFCSFHPLPLGRELVDVIQELSKTRGRHSAPVYSPTVSKSNGLRILVRVDIFFID